MTTTEQQVETLLREPAGVPWAVPSASLRQRTLASLARSRRRPVLLHRRVWVPLAAAASVAIVTGSILKFRGEPLRDPQFATEVRLDPGTLLPPAIARLTSSADESFSEEAKTFLEDTKGLTRRVLAQLPFTNAR